MFDMSCCVADGDAWYEATFANRPQAGLGPKVLATEIRPPPRLSDVAQAATELADTGAQSAPATGDGTAQAIPPMAGIEGIAPRSEPKSHPRRSMLGRMRLLELGGATERARPSVAEASAQADPEVGDVETPEEWSPKTRNIIVHLVGAQTQWSLPPSRPLLSIAAGVVPIWRRSRAFCLPIWRRSRSPRAPNVA